MELDCATRTVTPLKTSVVIFECYKTSALSESDQDDTNLELHALIWTAEMEPDYYSAKDSVSRHGVAPYLYFLSVANSFPLGCKVPCTDTASSAATPDAPMLEMMNKASVWEQVTDMATSDTSLRLKTK